MQHVRVNCIFLKHYCKYSAGFFFPRLHCQFQSEATFFTLLHWQKQFVGHRVLSLHHADNPQSNHFLPHLNSFPYFYSVTSSCQFPFSSSTSRHRNWHENTKGGTPRICLQLSPHFFCLSACDFRWWLIPVSAVIFTHSTHTGMITAVHQVWSRPHCAEVSQFLGLSDNDRGREARIVSLNGTASLLSSPVLGGADKHIHFTWSRSES